jgi:integration host factor subunit alpha
MIQVMPKSLTKADIITAIQTENGFTVDKSKESVENLLEVIKRTLESGEDVLVSGFGKFQIKNKRKRKGRNPATGDDMILPNRRVVTFKYSGRLKDKVNGG